MNDFESMMLGHLLGKIYSEPKTKKTFDLVTLNLKINMYSMIMEKDNGHMKMIKKANTNSRDERARPENSEKAVESSLILKSTDDFAKEVAAFASEWGRTVHGSLKWLKACSCLFMDKLKNNSKTSLRLKRLTFSKKPRRHSISLLKQLESPNQMRNSIVVQMTQN